MCYTMKMCHSSVYFGLFFFGTVQSQYFFKNAEDRDICKKANFVVISPYRVVSLTQMSWQSAHACCKMKGRLLHTIEKSVESAKYPLHNVLLEKFGTEAEDLQFWIGLSYHKDNFQWTFGTVLQQSHQKFYREMYNWVEGHPEKSSVARCVSISPFREILELRTLSCNTKLNFICQSIPHMGGEPLSGLDMMTVGSAEFLPIPGFKNLFFSAIFTRWPVANAVCQSRNWVLIDRVHELYGDKLANSLVNPANNMMNQNPKTFHSSGNDFCESQHWQWACGEKLAVDIPWLQDANTNSSNNAHCLQYIVQSREPNNATLVASSVNCNEMSYVICDTMPSCPVSEQYRCLNKDPHFVDPEKELKTEKNLCKASQFHQVNGPNGTTYWLSPSKFTWMGANACCQSRGWYAPAPKSMDEMKLLQESLSVDENYFHDTLWTSTSTLEYLPHSPLRFNDGKLLSRSLYTMTRADGFSYPSCGRINFMDLQKTLVRYVHADCLEKNLVVCEESKNQSHNIVVRRVLDEFDVANGFEQTVFERFFKAPNELELARRRKNHTRDVCLKTDIVQKYSENCPNSEITVDSIMLSHSNHHTKVPKEAKIAVPFQNKKILLEHLVRIAFYEEGNETESFKEHFAFQFLNYSVSIYSQLCPIVPQTFLLNSFKMFRNLHLTLNPKRHPEIISQQHFNWSMKLLGVCEELIKPTIIKHDNCGELAVAHKKCNNFICTDEKFEFNLNKTDILLDILWKVFEGVHAACFPAFKQNPMMHHKYALVIAELWENQDFRLRWSNQVARKGFWKRLLGPHFEYHVLSMERCTAATIEDSYFHVRLPRPKSLPHSVRLSGFAYEKLN